MKEWDGENEKARQGDGGGHFGLGHLKLKILTESGERCHDYNDKPQVVVVVVVLDLNEFARHVHRIHRAIQRLAIARVPKFKNDSNIKMVHCGLSLLVKTDALTL